MDYTHQYFCLYRIFILCFGFILFFLSKKLMPILIKQVLIKHSLEDEIKENKKRKMNARARLKHLLIT